MPIQQKAEERRAQKMGKVDALLHRLSVNEGAALVAVLRDTEMFSTTDVQRILQAEAQDTNRDQTVPVELYDINERSIGRWRQENLNQEVRGL